MTSPGSRLWATSGDRLVIQGHRPADEPRDGEILKVLGADGAPPYVVRWSDGRVSRLFPGSDAAIRPQ
jgi:hypothetical protein